jgi:hypothetical protein
MLDLDTGTESVVSDDSYRDRFPSVDGEIIAFTSDRLGLDGVVVTKQNYSKRRRAVVAVKCAG